MKKRRQIALNKLFNVCLALGLLFAFAAIELFVCDDVAWGIGSLIASLIVIIPTALFTPLYYSFDDRGVSFRYLFLPVEQYLWDDVYSITVEDKNFGSGNRSILIFLLYSSVFAIHGEVV